MSRKSIMSGENSREMWNLIKKIPKRKTKTAVYSLACHCQELEIKLEEALTCIQSLIDYREITNQRVGCISLLIKELINQSTRQKDSDQ